MLSIPSAPSQAALFEIAHRLNGHITFALGGSGLLAHHGLEDTVRDWDLTTDAPWAKVEPLLRGLSYELIDPSGIYASEYLCRIHLHDINVDLIGGFAVLVDGVKHNIPTVINGHWEDVPLASLSTWQEAYRLMGRHSKAARIAAFTHNRDC